MSFLPATFSGGEGCRRLHVDDAVLDPVQHLDGVSYLVLASEVGGALGDRLDHREALVLQGRLDEVDEQGDVIRGGAPNVRCARRLGQFAEVEAPLEVPVRSGGAVHALGRHRRVLAARHPVDVVVHDDRRDVDIAPRGVDEVVAAYRRAVAVARHHDDLELRPRELDARGEGEGPAVGRMQGVEVEVADGAGGAADPRHDADLVLVQAELLDRADESPGHGAVAAAGAPDVRKGILPEIAERRTHRAASAMMAA